MKRSTETLMMCIFWIIVAIYLVDCAVDAIANFELIGASMLAFKPSFTVSNLVRKDRRYGETDRTRNFGGLHTPGYRVLNAVSKTLLDSGLYNVCVTQNTRGQHKYIGYKSLFSVQISYGYSAVTIGARTIFAVDEWTRTIYHIDASGRLAACDYYQGYDVSDVIAQVSEAIDVLKEFYTADKLEVIAEKERSHDWMLDAVDNVGTVRDYKRATVKCWFVKSSNKSVEWRKQWVRTTPNGATQWKITTGSHPRAYQVVIGSTAYWLPHSILSRKWELHGGRVKTSDHGVSYFAWTGTIDKIDIPEWWLEKNIGADWSDNIDPLARADFFKQFINRKRRFNR